MSTWLARRFPESGRQTHFLSSPHGGLKHELRSGGVHLIRALALEPEVNLSFLCLGLCFRSTLKNMAWVNLLNWP